MANFPNTFASELQLLDPDMDLGTAGGNEALHDLMGRGYVAGYGLPEEIASEIIVMAREPGIVEFCPRDQGPKRFESLESTGLWLGKNDGRGVVWVARVKENDGRPVTARQLDTLTPGHLDPATWAWEGADKNKHVPGADITFAERVGIKAKQQKLAEPTARLVIAASVLFWDVKPEKISLETWCSNFVARHVYDKVGFIRPNGVALIEGTRPTLRKVGEIINAHMVFEDWDVELGELRNFVHDERDQRVYVGSKAA